MEMSKKKIAYLVLKLKKRLQEMKQYKTMMEKQKHSQEEVVYDIPTPQYKEENFFDTYKKLKSNFKQNNEEIIRDFISKHNETKETKNIIFLEILENNLLIRQYTNY